MSNNFDIVDITENFNKLFKKLLNIIIISLEYNEIDIDKSDIELLNNIKNKANILIETNPILVLENIGLYIFKYKQYIVNDSLDDLFEIDFINEFKKESNNTNNLDYGYNLFNILKKLWKIYKPSEKKKIHKMFKYLLSEYSKSLTL